MAVSGRKISAKFFPERENIWNLAFIINCDRISGQVVIVWPSCRDWKTHSKIIRWSFFSRSHWNIGPWSCGLSPKTANKKDKLGLYQWDGHDWMTHITLSKAFWASLLNCRGLFRAVPPFSRSERGAKSWFEMPSSGEASSESLPAAALHSVFLDFSLVEVVAELQFVLWSCTLNISREEMPVFLLCSGESCFLHCCNDLICCLLYWCFILCCYQNIAQIMQDEGIWVLYTNWGKYICYIPLACTWRIAHSLGKTKPMISF